MDFLALNRLSFQVPSVLPSSNKHQRIGKRASKSVPSTPAHSVRSKHSSISTGQTASARRNAARVESATTSVQNRDQKRDSNQVIHELGERLRRAVNAERRCEYEAIVELYSNPAVDRLGRKGVVLLDLTLAKSGHLYSSTKYKLTCAGGKNLPFHKFSARSTVLLSRVDQSWSGKITARDVEEKRAEATVSSVNSHSIEVVVDEENARVLDRLNQKGSLWRLDHSIRDVTSKRQLAAIGRLGELSEAGGQSQGVVQAMVLGLDYPVQIVKKVLPVWVRNSQWRVVSGGYLKRLGDLNESQRRAIASAQLQSVTLWQGPPGSGKTRTLLALLQVMCLANRDVPRSSTGPILACADTNAAVDNLVDGLLRMKIRVVRIGTPAKVREELRWATLEARAAKTEYGKWAASCMNESSDLEAIAGKAGNAMEKHELKRRSRDLFEQAKTLTKKAEQEVLRQCEVVAATCNGSGDPVLKQFPTFRMVVIDEASQSTEASTLVPLTQGAECFVLAGDPLQLPPTVLSKEALDLDLDVTLFERLAKRGLEPQLLDTQYRMHPAISAFPSAWFYKGRLKTGIDGHERPHPQGVKWPSPKCPVLLLACQGQEKRAKGGRVEGGMSYRNDVEAKMVLRVLWHVLQPGDVKDVALLSPYRGQVTLLEKMLDRANSNFEGPSVCVSSVDGYQGREADVVIFSTVRSNESGQLGFVQDARRLNVAITRAKSGLVVIGNPHTLESSKDWRAWLAWVKERGNIARASIVPKAPWEK